MAGQEDKNIRPDEDKSNICTDTGASTTNVVDKLVRVKMAENGTSMKATHVCLKSEKQIGRSGFA